MLGVTLKGRMRFVSVVITAMLLVAAMAWAGISLAGGTPTSAADDNQTNFRFVSNSNAATIGGVAHRMLMNGTGKVTASQVVGSGSFVHINSAAPVPKTILASGTWKAKRLVSFNLIGTYGSLAAGTLEMEVDLILDFPSPAVIPATLEIICNLSPAGLLTDEEEGFILTIDGAPFGQFKPKVPADQTSGLSVFTTGNEKRD